jgi:hypothetical protein
MMLATGGRTLALVQTDTLGLTDGREVIETAHTLLAEDAG